MLLIQEIEYESTSKKPLYDSGVASRRIKQTCISKRLTQLGDIARFDGSLDHIRLSQIML